MDTPEEDVNSASEEEVRKLKQRISRVLRNPLLARRHPRTRRRSEFQRTVDYVKKHGMFPPSDLAHRVQAAMDSRRQGLPRLLVKRLQKMSVRQLESVLAELPKDDRQPITAKFALGDLRKSIEVLAQPKRYGPQAQALTVLIADTTKLSTRQPVQDVAKVDVAEPSKSAAEGTPSMTDTTTDIFDDAVLSPARLAEVFNVPLDALRKRLGRLRRDDHNSFVENEGRKSTEAKYLYKVGAVRPIIKDMKRSSSTSSKRPAQE